MTKKDILQTIYDDSIREIDRRIVNIYNGETDDDNVCEGLASLLYVRKSMLNERIMPYLHLFVDDITSFNEEMIEAVRLAYSNGRRILSALENIQEPNSVDIKIRLFFHDELSEEYPANENEFWDILTDRKYNREYENGINITPIYFPCVYQTAEEYLGIEDEADWTEGFDRNLFRDAKMNMAFRHLYKDCLFSLIDIMLVKEFTMVADIKTRNVCTRT